MKIKTDFITNSSSTSFILMVKDEFTVDQFLGDLGVDRESEFVDIFEELFEVLKSNMEPLESYLNKCAEGIDYKDFIKDRYDLLLVEKINQAEKEGKKIYMGKLSSDGSEVEAFFCMESFCIDSDNLYLNGEICVW